MARVLLDGVMALPGWQSPALIRACTSAPPARHPRLDCRSNCIEWHAEGGLTADRGGRCGGGRAARLTPMAQDADSVACVEEVLLAAASAGGIVGAIEGGVWRAPAVEVLLREWRDSAAQLAVLRACLECPPSVRDVLLMGAGQADAELVELAGGRECAWSSCDVVAALLRLSESQGLVAVRPLIGLARSEGPGVLLAGLAQVCSLPFPPPPHFPPIFPPYL